MQRKISSCTNTDITNANIINCAIGCMPVTDLGGGLSLGRTISLILEMKHLSQKLKNIYYRCAKVSKMATELSHKGTE